MLRVEFPRQELSYTIDGIISDATQHSAQIGLGVAAVELGSGEELIAALHSLKAAALAGELDVQIETASGALRAGFVK